MSGLRPWQVSLWQHPTGAPMASLGVHVDLHTPTLDLHLPGWTVQIGRNGYWGIAGRRIGRMSSRFGGRVVVGWAEAWNGHTDNCDHALAPTEPEAEPA